MHCLPNFCYWIVQIKYSFKFLTSPSTTSCYLDVHKTTKLPRILNFCWKYFLTLLFEVSSRLNYNSLSIENITRPLRYSIWSLSLPMGSYGRFKLRVYKVVWPQTDDGYVPPSVVNTYCYDYRRRASIFNWTVDGSIKDR